MDLFALREALSLKEVEGGMIGEVDYYYFGYGEGKFGLYKGTFINFTFTESLNSSYLRKFMRKYRYGMILRTFIKKNDTISLIIPKKIKDDFVTKLKTLIETFRTSFLKQYKHCFVCNNEAEDVVEEAKISVKNGFAVYNHKECIAKYNQYIEKTESIQDGKVAKLPFSIVMAIGGAFVGLIPNILSIVFANLLIGYLFALIPLGSFFGYKLGGAPQKKYMTVLIVVLSFISVALMLLWFYTGIALELGFTDIMEMANFDEKNMGILIKDALISFLFVGIGIGISWKTITNADKPKKIL